MSSEMIIRAWTDPVFRAGLSDAELAMLPESPVGPAPLPRAASQASVRCFTVQLSTCTHHPSCCF